MGVMSSIAAIDNLHIRPLRRAANIKADAIAQVGETVVVKLANGTFYTNWRTVEKFAVMPGSYSGRMKEFLRCMVVLKVVPRADYEKHMSICKRRDIDSEARTDTAVFRRMAKKYGVPVPTRLFRKDDGTFGHEGAFARVEE